MHENRSIEQRRVTTRLCFPICTFYFEQHVVEFLACPYYCFKYFILDVIDQLFYKIFYSFLFLLVHDEKCQSCKLKAGRRA